MKNIIRNLLLLLIFLSPSELLLSQSFTANSDTIFVHGAKYFLNIERNSGIISIKNPDNIEYTRFPIFAYSVPAIQSIRKLNYMWEIKPPEIEMTVEDRLTKQTILKAVLRFNTEAFEIRFGIIPEIVDLGYDVNIINGSWPWGLGVDTSFARNSISLAGNKFHKGIGVHTASNVTFRLNKPLGFNTFEALVGLDDEVGKAGSVIFQVFADGKKVAETGTIKGGQHPEKLTATVTNAVKIELVVTDAGDGEDYDNADWAEARFITTSGTTTYVSDMISEYQKGLLLFSKDNQGFETGKWLKMFTPEPDNYYSNSSVMVGVRQDVDGQRFFAPAPLNLSFLTPAGWFSTGLCQLPDAANFIFRKGRIFIDYPWNKMKLQEKSFHWITPICFTFNQSEWDGIKDYRNYLLKNNYVSDISIEQKKIPGWWMYPLICTWGEQTLDNAEQKKPAFTSTWIKKYVTNLEKDLDLKQFSLIIDDKWQQNYGDPYVDSSRLKDLRELIDWSHNKGHKVLLWWRCWYGEKGSLPDRMGLLDGSYIDATNPRFEDYIKQSVKIMLGNGPGELDADGFKIDYIFDVRNPATAIYANPSLGIGYREVYRYADIWYKESKKIKEDCLITFSGTSPHFSLVQDMSRINDAGRDSLQRQNRAHVSSLSVPNLLIDGDGADMFVPLANYHHITSSVFATPSLYYLSRFPDGPISDEMHKITGNIFKLAALKRPGHPVFLSFGNWQSVRDEEVVAESFLNGTGIIVYNDMFHARLLTTINQDLKIPLHNAVPVKVLTEEGKITPFKILPSDEILVPNAQKGKVYTIILRKSK